MNNSKRQHHTPEEKVSILRRHLIEKVPVSNLCEEFGLHPVRQLTDWLKQFFENGAAAFANHRPDSGRQRDQERVAALERKLQTKNEVLAELMEEHVALKKVLGRADRPLGAPGHPRPGDRFRPALVGTHRDQRRSLHPLAEDGSQQVLLLARALWTCQ